MAVWFITGSSSGFGYETALAALARGDKVVATARNASTLKDLKAMGALTLALDITGPESEIQKVVAQAVAEYGKIDILFNNAGMVLEGAVEECSDTEIRSQFDINVFGHLAVTRAVLPYMRAHRSGVIAFMGSIAGWAGTTGAAFYCATKFALVGIAGGLRAEVQHLGIDVTVIEPGYFRTKLLESGNKVTAKKRVEDLRVVMDPLRHAFRQKNGKQDGDPVKGAHLIVEAITESGRCAGRQLPLRLPLGSDAVRFIGGVIEQQKNEFVGWADLAVTTDHDDTLLD